MSIALKRLPRDFQIRACTEFALTLAERAATAYPLKLPRRSPRGGDPRTPSGPEGSSGNGDAGRRGVAGADSFISDNNDSDP
jgi:hypothetical protein